MDHDTVDEGTCGDCERHCEEIWITADPRTMSHGTLHL